MMPMMKMVGKLMIVKNWVLEPARTGHLANKSPAGAIVGGFPSKYSPPAVFKLNSDSKTSLNQNLGGYNDKDGTKYRGNPRLMARWSVC
jgi:hypothetical protein